MAYFQKGVSHFIMGDMEAAMQDFDDAFSVSGNILAGWAKLDLMKSFVDTHCMLSRN